MSKQKIQRLTDVIIPRSVKKAFTEHTGLPEEEIVEIQEAFPHSRIVTVLMHHREFQCIVGFGGQVKKGTFHEIK